MMIKFFEKNPLYPFLIAIYPILYLLSENINQTEIRTSIRSALLFFFISLIIFLVGLVITRSVQKSALVSLVVLLTFFLVIFLVYAPVYTFLREVHLFGQSLGRHRYLIPAFIVGLIGTGLIAVRLSQKLKPSIIKSLTFGMNLLAIALILLPATNVLIQSARKHQAQDQEGVVLPSVPQQSLNIISDPPDIYYLIFDMHTSDHVMSQLMDFDDDQFTDSLRAMGFYVATCSRSNYSTTQYSITSSLNMDYIQEISTSTDDKAVFPFAQYSLVQRTLEKMGYTTYAFETGFPFTELRNVDKYYSPNRKAVDLLTYPGLTPFESLVMQVSGGRVLYESRDQLSQRMQYILDAPYVEYRDRILYTLDTIPRLTSDPGPKFVFAHILAPHDPFVFDAYGNTAFRRTPFSLNQDPEFGPGYGWNPYKNAYIQEITYIHKRILDLVETLQQNSAVPPIILIQGDHGIPRLVVSDAQYDIYNAYYLGEFDYKQLYEQISPVNSFRVIFNTLIGTDYQLLPDESYVVEDGEFIRFDHTQACPPVFRSPDE